MGKGGFVAIVGPSGVGKDTLIAHARRALADDERFLFVRRMVTRESNPFEDHDTIDEAAFADGCTNGGFALAWRAHGLGYALPTETIAAIEAGSVAVCNLSRGAIAAARQRFPRVLVIFITAPADVLAARLVGRGRETVEAVAERLRREAARADQLRPDLVILNDGPVERAARELEEFLRRLMNSTEGSDLSRGL